MACNILEKVGLDRVNPLVIDEQSGVECRGSGVNRRLELVSEAGHGDVNFDCLFFESASTDLYTIQRGAIRSRHGAPTAERWQWVFGG